MAWYIDSNGVIYDGQRQLFGYFDVNGDVYDKNNITSYGAPSGYPTGFVDINGNAYDIVHQNRGFADVDGTIYDMGHLATAIVAKDGQVYSIGGIVIGRVNIAIHQSVHMTQWRPMIYRASAAILLLLKK
jgi:hypothetical protein